MQTAKTVNHLTHQTISESQNAVDKYGYVIFQIIGIIGVIVTTTSMVLKGFSIIYTLMLIVSLVFALCGYIWNKTEKSPTTISFS